MEIYNVIKEMESAILDSPRLPWMWQDRSVIHRSLFLKALSTLRAKLPEAVQEAEKIVRERDAIITDARHRGKKIELDAEDKAREAIRRAQAEADRLVEQTEIVKTAKARANDCISQSVTHAREVEKQAQSSAEKIRRDALDYGESTCHDAEAYALHVFTLMEGELSKVRGVVDGAIRQLKDDSAARENKDGAAPASAATAKPVVAPPATVAKNAEPVPVLNAEPDENEDDDDDGMIVPASADKKRESSTVYMAVGRDGQPTRATRAHNSGVNKAVRSAEGNPSLSAGSKSLERNFNSVEESVVYRPPLEDVSLTRSHSNASASAAEHAHVRASEPASAGGTSPVAAKEALSRVAAPPLNESISPEDPVAPAASRPTEPRQVEKSAPSALHESQELVDFPVRNTPSEELEDLAVPTQKPSGGRLVRGGGVIRGGNVVRGGGVMRGGNVVRNGGNAARDGGQPSGRGRGLSRGESLFSGSPAPRPKNAEDSEK